jgi:hypothetical protein
MLVVSGLDVHRFDMGGNTISSIPIDSRPGPIAAFNDGTFVYSGFKSSKIVAPDKFTLNNVHDCLRLAVSPITGDVAFNHRTATSASVIGVSRMDGVLHKIKARTGTQLPVIEYSQDGSLLIVIGYSITLFKTQTYTEVSRVDGFMIDLMSLCNFVFSMDGHRLLVLYPSNDSIVFNTMTGETITRFSIHGLCGVFTPDGLIILDAEWTIRVLNTDYEETGQYPLHYNATRSVVFTMNESVIVGYGHKQVGIWSTGTGQVIRIKDFDGIVSRVKLIPETVILL